jgi:o-succinylbenzoate synthase
VNAILGAVDPQEAAQCTEAFCKAGYHCIKVKVGSEAWQEDWERIAAVRAIAGAGVHIRIDANQAWSITEAIAHLRQAESLQIEYVEQPVAAGDLEGMAEVRRSVGIPIAADEAVNSLAQLQQVIQHGAADLVILKPMALGGILAARRAASIALEAGLDVVVTTTLDGAIARQGALHLTASLPIQHACGLATGHLLASDLLETFPQPQHGTLSLSTKAGLGLGSVLSAEVERNSSPLT